MSLKRSKKSIQFKMDDFDEEQGIFSGYGAIFGNIDSGGDVIEPGAFSKTLASGWERVKILALHNDCWLPIGKPLELKEDENGLFISAKISDTQMGRDVKALLKDGVLNELSIGYDPVTFDIDEDGIRHLKELDLWEVSVVTWAMNPQATIADYKSTDAGDSKPVTKGEVKEIIQEAIKEMKTDQGAGGKKSRHAPIFLKNRKSSNITINF
ncbi:MAG: HK97 family phage prohead protease [Lachnospiraceae bacterium]